MGPHPYPTIVRDFQRVIGDEAAAQITAIGGSAARSRRRLRRRWVERDRPLQSRSSASRRAPRRGRGRGRRHRAPAITPRRSRRAAWASSTARGRCCSRTPTARSSRRTRSPPGSTTRASDRSSRRSPPKDRLELAAATDAQALAAMRQLARTRESCPRSSRRTRSRRCPVCSRTPRRGRIVLVGLSGRGDKDVGHLAAPAMTRDDAGLAADRSRVRGCASAGSHRVRAVRRGGLSGHCDRQKPLALAAIDAGADLLEIGLPYSDPLADGVTLQRASAAALARGADPGRVARPCRACRAASVRTRRCWSWATPTSSWGRAARTRSRSGWPAPGPRRDRGRSDA